MIHEIPTADRDARQNEEFAFNVMPQKHRGSKTKNPRACVMANECSKQGMPAWFGKKIALVQIPNKKGKMEWVRFTYPAATKAAIDRFDRTGKVTPGVFYLKAPAFSESQRGRAISNKEHWLRRVEKKGPHKGRKTGKGSIAKTQGKPLPRGMVA